MTWNVENLFLPTSDAERAAYEAKVAALAATIKGQDPDLVALQEVGEPAALEDLVAALGPSSSGEAWHSVLSRFPDDRGIRVAWISPRRLTDALDVHEYPAHLPPVTVDDAGTTIRAMRRGALAVTLTAASGLAVRALTAHFKSKRLSFPSRPGAPLGGGSRSDTRDEAERARFASYALNQRAADAVTVRAWATSELDAAGHGQEHALLVCGDLNDVPRAATSEIIIGPGGSEFGTPGFDAPDRGDDQRLWNTFPLMPEGRDWSRIDFGRKELLDQVFVSARLARHVTEAGAVADPVDDVERRPRVLSPAAAAERPSDHRPVVVRFDA